MFPFFIILILFWYIMISSINLYDEFCFVSVKISYKIKNGVLSFETYL